MARTDQIGKAAFYWPNAKITGYGPYAVTCGTGHQGTVVAHLCKSVMVALAYKTVYDEIGCRLTCCNKSHDIITLREHIHMDLNIHPTAVFKGNICSIKCFMVSTRPYLQLETVDGRTINFNPFTGNEVPGITKYLAPRNFEEESKLLDGIFAEPLDG